MWIFQILIRDYDFLNVYVGSTDIDVFNLVSFFFADIVFAYLLRPSVIFFSC